MPQRPADSRLVCGATVLLLAWATAMPGAHAATDGPLYRWQFQQKFVDGQSFKSLKAGRRATVKGPVLFSGKPPLALLLDGNSKARHHVSVATGLKKLTLPQKAISVETWISIERPAEWGGLCRIIQDNGDYERGWLLGYRKQNFFFAVSSEKKKKLTYLIDPRGFETGYWNHVVGTYDAVQTSLAFLPVE